jgi:hypothetical protein
VLARRRLAMARGALLRRLVLKPQPGGDAGALVAERAGRHDRPLGTGLTVFFSPAGEWSQCSRREMTGT